MKNPFKPEDRILKQLKYETLVFRLVYLTILGILFRKYSFHLKKHQGRSCTPFSVLKQRTRPTIGSSIIVGEIQHWEQSIPECTARKQRMCDFSEYKKTSIR